MRRTLITLSIGAIFACAAFPASAGIYEKSFEVGLHGGVQSGDSDVNVSSDSSYGLKFAFAINPKIQIEMGVSKFDTFRDVNGFVGPASNPTQQKELSVDVPTEFTYYSVGLTANFLTETDSRTIPYVSVGLGSVVQSTEEFLDCTPINIGGQSGLGCLLDVERKDTGTLLNAGVGARTFIGEWFAVRYEARYYHHDAIENNQDAFEFSVGPTFVIGGRR